MIYVLWFILCVGPFVLAYALIVYNAVRADKKPKETMESRYLELKLRVSGDKKTLREADRFYLKYKGKPGVEYYYRNLIITIEKR